MQRKPGIPMSEEKALPKLRPLDVIPYLHQGQQLVCLRDPSRLSEHQIHISPEALPIIAMLDGKRTARDIQVAFMRRTGQLLDSDLIAKVVSALNNARFLENEEFEAWKARLEEEFRASPVREPIMAGSGYPEDPEELSKFAGGFFTAEGAPGKPGPAGSRTKPVHVLIVPHIDLRHGGISYAHGYKALWESFVPETVVLMGVAHAGNGPLFSFTMKDFKTPLGMVETDEELTKRLAESVGESAFEDECVHRSEHSIEIQLVFLQYLARDAPAVAGGGAPPRIVPVLCGSLQECIAGGKPPGELPEMKRFSAALGELLREEAGRVALLVSADLAHVGQKFGDAVPLTPRLLRKLEEEDRKMLAHVCGGEAEGFFEFVRAEEDRRRICGLTAIYTALSALGRSEGELLHYAQAPEETTQSVVSFASLALAAPDDDGRSDG